MDAILADYADEIYSEGNHKKDSYYKTLGPKAIFYEWKIQYWYQTFELRQKKKKIIAIGIDMQPPQKHAHILSVYSIPIFIVGLNIFHIMDKFLAKMVEQSVRLVLGWRQKDGKIIVL